MCLVGFRRGAALAAVDRLLSCTSSSDNVTNGEKAITSNPRNNGDSASSVKDTAASSVVKEWQLIGKPSYISLPLS